MSPVLDPGPLLAALAGPPAAAARAAAALAALAARAPEPLLAALDSRPGAPLAALADSDAAAHLLGSLISAQSGALVPWLRRQEIVQGLLARFVASSSPLERYGVTSTLLSLFDSHGNTGDEKLLARNAAGAHAIAHAALVAVGLCSVDEAVAALHGGADGFCLDVAQGNAELIKIGSQAILIDTGKHSEYGTLQSQLKSLGVKAISTLVVTHPDADHMESADDVIADYKVKKIILPQIASTTQCYKRMISAISKYNVKMIHPQTGSVLKLAPSCKGTVLSADASSSDTNEASIVMRVTYGSRSFLYMGDATARVENSILASGKPVASDIYLLSHHGSDTANGVLFVKKALSSKYKTAIISVGKNIVDKFRQVLCKLVKNNTYYGNQKAK